MKRKQPKRDQRAELFDPHNGVKLIADDYHIHVDVNIAHPHVKADEEDKEFAEIDWRSTGLFFNNLPDLAKFICSLTKSYNARVDQMNKHVERSMPLRPAKKLRSVKTLRVVA